jgi:hypothetical protein
MKKFILVICFLFSALQLTYGYAHYTWKGSDGFYEIVVKDDATKKVKIIKTTGYDSVRFLGVLFTEDYSFDSLVSEINRQIVENQDVHEYALLHDGETEGSILFKRGADLNRRYKILKDDYDKREAEVSDKGGLWAKFRFDNFKLIKERAAMQFRFFTGDPNEADYYVQIRQINLLLKLQQKKIGGGK